MGKRRKRPTRARRGIISVVRSSPENMNVKWQLITNPDVSAGDRLSLKWVHTVAIKLLN